MNSTEISDVWLKNIQKLDSKNHLGHGEIYAKDGSIKEFDMDGSVIKAKVQGAPGDIYDVDIQFVEFTNNNKNTIIDFIENNLEVYSCLLNNEIHEELFNMKVKVLPNSLKDFKMSCSCNNGLFCKHKAAVFHKLANEIKKDPFLIFKLWGFDLKKVIEEDNLKIKSVRDILNEKQPIFLNEPGDINFLNKLNWMLKDNPSFYPSNSIDFKEIINDILASMSKCSYRIKNPLVKNDFQEYIILGNTLRSFEYFSSKSSDEIRKAFESKWGNPQNWETFKVDIDGNYEIVNIYNHEMDSNVFQNNIIYSFFAFFAEMQQIDCEEYCENIKFLKEVFSFTLQLIYLNALMPEFFRLDNGMFNVRWIPVFQKDIFKNINNLMKKCPENILTFYGINISEYNQVLVLISLFFNGFSHYYIKKYIPHNLSYLENDRFFRLFFINSQELNKQYEGYDLKINNWLSTLYLGQKEYKIILNTRQEDFEFILEINIEIDGEIYSIDEIVLKRRLDIINDLNIINYVFSNFGRTYDLNNFEGMNLRQFSFFIENIAPIFSEIGIEVNAPEEFETLKDVKLLLNSNLDYSPKTSLSIENIIDFDWKIAIGDETFTIDEFKTFSQNYKGLVKIKDKYYVIDEKTLDDLNDAILKIPKSNDKSELIKYLLSSSSDNVEIDNKLENLIDNMLNVEKINVPHSLNGTLRKYQEIGFSWLIQNLKVGFGSILADDMGLGKTIQLITAILYLKENDYLKDGKVLIVAPTSILTNWYKEIEKFAPSLKTEIYHGMGRIMPENDFDILLTSYGMVRHDLKVFNKMNWFLIAIDEAQNIKNQKTKQTKAIKAIKAKHHIALSGTPIENHLAEYWSIFDFINKGYLYTLKGFKKQFIKPIENERNMDVLEDFKRITSPFILRRLKTDKSIIEDLPDKIINDVYCNLTVKQATMYEEILEDLIRDVEGSEGIERKGNVLKLINSLKQICNHPSQFLKHDEAKINESGKLEVLISILENMLVNDEKVLIFTQYVQMGKLMKKALEEKFSEEVLFLHGGVTRKKRDEMIEKFQNGSPKIFILSLKAGGIGLNLTAASNVVHYDLWWNPAVENQATDRAYRIGQNKNVMVYRFITSGTLEENINRILMDKRELVDLAISSEESFITEMSDSEIRSMLNLRNDAGDGMI